MSLVRPRKSSTQEILDTSTKFAKDALSAVKTHGPVYAKNGLHVVGHAVGSEISVAASNQMSHYKFSRYVSVGFGFVWLLNGDLTSGSLSVLTSMLSVYQEGMFETAKNPKLAQNVWAVSWQGLNASIDDAKELGKSLVNFVGGMFTKPVPTPAKEPSSQAIVQVVENDNDNNKKLLKIN